MLKTLLSLVFATPAAHAGCTDGSCTLVEGVETPTSSSGAVQSSLGLTPGAHLRTATFALG